MPETAAESRSIRFMTYNIQHGMGMDGSIDIRRTAAVIAGAGPDIVFLQEVDRFVSRSGEADQMMSLAELTGLAHVQFGRSIGLEGGEYGNGILSRYPLQRLALLELPGEEPRSALVCRADLSSGQEAGLGLHLIATHLDYGSGRCQLDSAASIRQASTLWQGAPAVLAGDFNAIAGSPVLMELQNDWRTAPGGMDIPTYPSPKPDCQLDYLFLNHSERWGETSVQAWPGREASDHLPIVMDAVLHPVRR
ncbi:MULTISPECIES: endonuclease/exonuclease/phosphatase family protein [unclassified Paenibacillus]|uniref:endonuclease/exonuclease/phosphatase family protein n=1 Tax=unclassified Paenibacillus TaxID=185978 RepID=UPI000955A1ED|nr:MULTISPECIES: endonuclease/exonuclease/phosphatase family protein [unclassified Paenibacillus]ASS65196.1 endonuclease [Paenibacillus sp. RUD330]SIQ44622.1 Metal-dependent hydrolase, endonuclease/exonuclease/phosphatase family [Paenibacillus sp. RU4X]SIQ66928.1 Metal-dependent hydrolase, endonuclease/exonuclease/phosphatase family [Paenibacillus sp. RU4T]